MTLIRALNDKRKRIFFMVMLAILCCALITGCNEEKDIEEDNSQIESGTEQKDDGFLNEETAKSVRQENELVIGKKEHPEDYYIKWAVPKQYVSINEEWINRINEKLEQDGYDFGLKIVMIEAASSEELYSEAIFTSGADIVFTGLETETDENGDIIRNSEIGMEQRKFECLDTYLKGSFLYDSRPTAFWDRVRYNGSIYLVPSEILQIDRKIVLYNDTISFYNDIRALAKCVEKKQSLFYGLSGFDFMNCFGYFSDQQKGVVVNEKGELVNPLNEECCIEWLRTLHEIYESGLLVTNDSSIEQREACDIRLSGNSELENGRYGYIWKVPLCQTYKCSTAILTTSDKKEKAFKLIEILRTEHDYGNLLIYGISDPEKDKPQNSAYLNKLIFGLDDGLIQVEDNLTHFNNYTDRNNYYEDSIVLSPTLYMAFPPEYNELHRIVEHYLGIYDSIICHEGFEEELKEFKDVYSTALEKMVSKMGLKDEN